MVFMGYLMFAILAPGHFPAEAACLSREPDPSDYARRKHSNGRLLTVSRFAGPSQTLRSFTRTIKEVVAVSDLQITAATFP